MYLPIILVDTLDVCDCTIPTFTVFYFFCIFVRDCILFVSVFVCSENNLLMYFRVESIRKNFTTHTVARNDMIFIPKYMKQYIQTNLCDRDRIYNIYYRLECFKIVTIVFKLLRGSKIYFSFVNSSQTRAHH